MAAHGTPPAAFVGDGNGESDVQVADGGVRGVHLTAGSARAADVGANVVEALRERPRVRVIVALREPSAPVANLSLRNQEVHGVQGRVLDRSARAISSSPIAWNP